MFLQIDEMRTGANTSYNASWLAMEGKQALSRATIAAGIFGDFADADEFHSGICDAHRRHVGRLQNTETRLGALGDQAHVAASAFADMEARNKAALEALR